MKSLYISFISFLAITACHPVKSLMVSPTEEPAYYRPLSLETPQPASRALSPFLDNLNRYYIRLSEEKWKENQLDTARFYAKKALDVTRGRAPNPTEIKELRLPPATLNTLLQAREFLITHYRDHLKEHFPQGSAKAQAMFDCWVQEVQHTAPSGNAPSCQQRFTEARASIETFLKNPAAFAHIPKVPRSLPISIPPIPPKTQATIPIPRTVFSSDLSTATSSPYSIPGAFQRYRIFLNNQDLLNPEVKNALDRIISEAIKHKPSAITIIGHGQTPDLSEEQVLGVVSYFLADDLKRELFQDLRAYNDVPEGERSSVEIYFVR